MTLPYTPYNNGPFVQPAPSPVCCPTMPLVSNCFAPTSAYNSGPQPIRYPYRPIYNPVANTNPNSAPRYGTPVNPPPWEMAPWVYYRPLPNYYRYPGNTTGNSYTQNQTQTYHYPTQQVTPQPPEPKPVSAPLAAPTEPIKPTAATPLRRDEIEPSPMPEPPATPPVPESEKAPAEAAAKEPDLPLPTEDYPLTKELINQWDAALDDPHPFHGNRVPTAFEIARFMEEHPHVTLTGKPREIMTRFAENILSTHRSDADNEYEVERDAMLIAIDQGFFYNPPERVMKHVRDIANRGLGLHGQEQPLAAAIIRKYDKGLYRPSQQIVDETFQKYPWLKAQQAGPIAVQQEGGPAPAEYLPPDTPNHQDNRLNSTMATQNIHPIRGAMASDNSPLNNGANQVPNFNTTKESPSLWQRIKKPFKRNKKEPDIPPMANILNGQQLDVTSSAYV